MQLRPKLYVSSDWNGIFPVLIAVAAKMQTNPAKELIVLTSSSYIDGSSRRGLARCAKRKKKLHREGTSKERRMGSRSRWKLVLKNRPDGTHRIIYRVSRIFMQYSNSLSNISIEISEIKILLFKLFEEKFNISLLQLFMSLSLLFL